jgi:hypothetical protein
MAENPIRSLLDLASVPIHAYRMPDDGRKWSHRCLQRRAVAQELASHANPDGSNIWASVETMAGRIGFSARTFRYICDELVELGFLINGKQRGLNGGRIRKLNVAAILKAGQTLHHSDVTLQDSVAEPCNIAAEPCNIDGQTLHHSAPNPATWPANPAPIQLQPTALQTAHPTALLTGSDGWKAFVEKPGNVPEEMDGAIEGKHLPDLEKVLAKLGERVTSELIWLWRDKRDMPLDGYKANRWKAFLDEGTKQKLILQAEENAKRAKSRQHIWWEKNTPEGRAAFDNQEAAGQLAGEKLLRDFARQKAAKAEVRIREEIEEFERNGEIPDYLKAYYENLKELYKNLHGPVEDATASK